MHVPPRILIVDDNESNRDILVTRLATHGYDLCQAADGEAALAAAKTLLPAAYRCSRAITFACAWRP